MCRTLRLSPVCSLPSRVVASCPVGLVSACQVFYKAGCSEPGNLDDSIGKRCRPEERPSTQWKMSFYFSCAFLQGILLRAILSQKGGLRIKVIYAYGFFFFAVSLKFKGWTLNGKNKLASVAPFGSSVWMRGRQINTFMCTMVHVPFLCLQML